MIRSKLVLAFAALVSSASAFAGAAPPATGASAVANSAVAAVPGTTAPTPPGAPAAGPDYVLTVPIALHNLPPEVNQYEVTCQVLLVRADNGRPLTPDMVTAAVTQPAYAQQNAISHQVAGSGVDRGDIPTTAGASTQNFTAEATVGVFLNARHKARPELVRWYQCDLVLKGTAYEVTTQYLSSSVSIPLAPGAPFKRIAEGLL